jgi:hypothetical protein
MTASSVSNQLAVAVDERVLRAAVTAYLGRYRGESRVHTGSDLKVFLTWCSGQELDPLNVGQAEIERYVRWLQEVRRYQPSTVSRRLSVVVGFYRVCVIDQILATRLPTTCAGQRCRPTRPPWDSGGARPNCAGQQPMVPGPARPYRDSPRRSFRGTVVCRLRSGRCRERGRAG